MALIPQDRRGQMLAFGVLLAAAVVYFVWSGPPVGGIPGVSQLTAQRDSLQNEIDTLEAAVRNARRDVASGAIQALDERLAEYQRNLDLMRQLVPAGAEIPNLLDDISSRAKVRGANVVAFEPQALESGAPFDTQRARFTVTGQYDQVGEFLTDIASLPRIVVPYDLRLERITSPTADTLLRARAMLSASFNIRTYVKSPDTTAAAAAGRAAP